MRTQAEQYEINLTYNITTRLQEAALEDIKEKNARTKAQRELDEFYRDYDYGGAK
jgi:hypothetical protein